MIKANPAFDRSRHEWKQLIAEDLKVIAETDLETLVEMWK